MAEYKLFYSLRRNIMSASVLNIFSRSKLTVAVTALTLCLSFNAFADRVIARGDFEGGDTDNWQLWQGRDKSRQFQLVTSPTRQGRYAAKFEVRPGDEHNNSAGERSELSNLLPKDIPTSNRDRAGDDYYYAWSTYFPSGFPDVGNWAVITQWHEEASGLGSVNLAVRINGGNRLALTHNTTTGSSAKTYNILSSIKTGVWHDFIVRVKWSCGRDGILELWHKEGDQEKYEKKVNQHNIQTAKYTNKCNAVYKKLGFYRSGGSNNSGTTHVIFHDGYSQGTSFDAVAEHSHGTTARQDTSLPSPEDLEVIDVGDDDEESDKGESDLEEYDNNEEDIQESDREEANNEESDLEEYDDEEEDIQESDREEANNEESDLEEYDDEEEEEEVENQVNDEEEESSPRRRRWQGR